MAYEDDRTMMYRLDLGQDEVALTLLKVYQALEEKGYDPVDQIVGYLLSGDPSYITSHEDARGAIRKINRDELLEVLVRSYLTKMRPAEPLEGRG